LEQIAAYIAGLSADALPQVFLEDVALCAAWLESHQNNPSELAKYPNLHTQIDAWVAVADPEWAGDHTAGSRQQPLLRLYVNDLIRGKINQMAHDELDLLYFAWVLSERSEKEGLFERSLDCLRPFVRQLEKQREATALCPGLPHLGEAVAHFSIEDLKQAEPRDVKLFAGLDAPVRGPVLLHTGDVKIIGDIPEDCAVVVEEGACYVRGDVHGKLAAARNCEILGAVSGIVVTRRGQIRAGKVVHPARVISKEGSVAVLCTESPRLIFAANDLRVARGGIGGKYRAHEVIFEGPILGGEVHVSGKCTGTFFEATDERALAIVLRRTLSCRDYGEVLTHESSRLLTAAMYIRQRVHHLRGLAELTDREADEYAGNVIRFILGSENNSTNRAQSIQQIRRSMAFIDRLEIALDSLVKSIEDQLDLDGSSDSGTSESSRVDVRILVEDLESDLGQLVAEGPLSREVMDYREVVTKAAKETQRAFVTENQIIMSLQSLLTLRDTLSDKRVEFEDIERNDADVPSDTPGQAAVLEKAKQNRARIEVLAKLLSLAHGGGGNEGFRRLCNDRYVKLMQRNIEHRKARVIEFATQVRKLEADIGTIRNKLWRDYRVSLPRHVVEQMPDILPTVEGAFSAGVRVLAWPHLVESKGPDGAAAATTQDTDSQVVTFERLEEGAVRLVSPDNRDTRRRRSRDRRS
jgi:hypothetical protein